MRCPDCNKFVSLDSEQDPEFDLTVDDDGVVSGTAQITNTCQDCGTELRGAALDVEADLSGLVQQHRDEFTDKKGKLADGHGKLEVETADERRNMRFEGKGRGTKTFYGAEATIKVVCECGEEFTEDWSGDVRASSMDELV